MPAGSEREAMGELASLLWKRYFQDWVRNELRHELKGYRAQVAANNGDGTLTVQRPFEETAFTLPCINALRDAEAGDQVLIVAVGSLSNAVVFCKTDGSTFPPLDMVLSSYPTDTASGNPAQFSDGAKSVPVISLSADIELTQSGSGIASPTNIRPITAWTGGEFFRSGADTSAAESWSVYWGNLAGNVYAGTVNAISGGLSVTWADMDMSSVTYSTRTSSYVQARVTAPTGIANILSDRFSNQATSGTPGRMSVASGYLYFNIPIAQVPSYDTAGVREWIAEYQPQFVYALPAPAEYSVSKVPMQTLLGENRIWADCGTVTVEYRADPTLYIEKKLGS